MEARQSQALSSLIHCLNIIIIFPSNPDFFSSKVCMVECYNILISAVIKARAIISTAGALVVITV